MRRGHFTLQTLTPTYFPSAAAWRAWLAEHHESATEIIVGFHKVGSGEPTMSWPESVDEALCFGWIDGVRRRVDDTRYTIRFTPRRATSTWGLVNIRRVGDLEAEGRMQAAGRAAFARRRQGRTGIYSYEQRTDVLPDPYRTMLEQDAAAFAFFQLQSPSYRNAAIWWVLSAKQETTRQKRLALLIADSASGHRLGMFDRRR